MGQDASPDPYLLLELHRGKLSEKSITGISAVGSAPALGGGRARENVKLEKTCKRLRCNGFVDWIFFPMAIFGAFDQLCTYL